MNFNTTTKLKKEKYILNSSSLALNDAPQIVFISSKTLTNEEFNQESAVISSIDWLQARSAIPIELLGEFPGQFCGCVSIYGRFSRYNKRARDCNQGQGSTRNASAVV